MSLIHARWNRDKIRVLPQIKPPLRAYIIVLVIVKPVGYGVEIAKDGATAIHFHFHKNNSLEYKEPLGIAY